MTPGWQRRHTVAGITSSLAPHVTDSSASLARRISPSHFSRGVSVASLLVYTGVLSFRTHADDWSQWQGSGRDGIYREDGIIDSIPPSGLKVRWRTPIERGFSGPAVAGERVFVTDRLKDPDRERVVCLASTDGAWLWDHAYPCEYAEMEYGNGPRATPTIHEGLVYTLGTKGHFHCLDAETGALQWKKDFVQEVAAVIPRYGASAAPLIEKDLVIVMAGGTPDATVMAFDRLTGEERWRALGDRPAYSAPIIFGPEGTRQLIVWTADGIHSLDPVSGTTYWTVPFEANWDPAQAIGSPVRQGDHLLFVMG